MSYMDHNTAFAIAGGIQEMSFDEVELVGGGPLWAPLLACAANPACVTAVRAGAAIVALAAVAAFDYFF